MWQFYKSLSIVSLGNAIDVICLLLIISGSVKFIVSLIMNYKLPTMN